MRRGILGSSLVAAAVAMIAASTAYACVTFKGDGTVSGATRTSNLMTGAEVHDYCSGRSPTTAAAGATGSITFTYAPATACTSSTNKLSAGTYDVRLRNVNGSNTAYTGSDSVGWTQVSGAGCFRAANAGSNNYDLGDMTVTTTTSNNGGSGSWSLPSGLVTNGLTDASIFCVGKKGADGTVSGTADGFLAPFRVATT